MILAYKQERELHDIVTTTTIEFEGDPAEWMQLVERMKGSAHAAMIRSVESIVAEYEGEEA